MASKPSMVHPCTPPPAVEILERRLGQGDVWTCPTCGDEWNLARFGPEAGVGTPEHPQLTAVRGGRGQGWRTAGRSSSSST
jgi:hypothetical protein